MLRFIGYAAAVLLLSAAIVAGLFVAITAWPQDVFDHTYQSEIQVRYNKLIETDDPKIIILGGSSATYGINEDMLEEKTGYKVVNLGLYASFGDLIPAELSKANINAGDIVICAYEYGWNKENDFDTIGADMVMSGFDSHIEMYRYIPLRIWPQLIGYLGDFREKKKEYETNPGEDIRGELFDGTGRLVLDRPSGTMHYDPDGDKANPQDVTNTEIADDSAKYLRKYKNYVETRGATIVFTAPPLLDKALDGTAGDLEKLVSNEESEIGIPYISDPADYLLNEQYFYDTVYHCSSEGADLRTQMLAEDLENAGVLSR